MGIRTAADIHRVQRGHLRVPIATAGDYLAALQQAMEAQGKPVRRLFATPAVYVDGWKWCIVCGDGVHCGNRPAYAWGIAGCFDCGAYYEDLVLPADADEIERILAFRPKLAQRSWYPGETLDALRAENASIGVPA